MTKELMTIYGMMSCYRVKDGVMVALIEPVDEYKTWKRANESGSTQTEALSNLFNSLDREKELRDKDPIKYDLKAWINEIISELDILFDLNLPQEINNYIEAKLIEEIHSRFNERGIKYTQRATKDV